MSPAAKRAMIDGSLDPTQTHMCRISNRKLKMRDTFTKIMPTYNHGEPSALSTTHSHWNFQYQDDQKVNENLPGQSLHSIPRRHTHKKDFMKEYHESMLKIENLFEMKRTK